VQKGTGAKDFQTGDLAVLPVDDHEGLHPLRWVAWDAIPARSEGFVGQVDVGGVGRWVVADPHVLRVRRVAGVWDGE
jgi:hypothetical protein